MKTARTIVLCLLLVCAAASAGCGGKADEDKPMSEVKAEAEKMDAGQLRNMAAKYKDAIAAKGEEVKALTAKLKEIPVTEMLGEKAKSLKAQIEKLGKSVSSLKERFQVYYNSLKEKGGDTSGLD
jgi:hypothetical protein